MNINYEHKPEMTFIGFSTLIHPDEGYIKCPEFWDKEFTQKYSHLWQTMQPETSVEQAILDNHIGMFAICDDKEGCFEYWIAGIYEGGKIPEGLKLYTFPESDWAVFSAKGALPDSLQNLNTYIWNEWYPNEGMQYMGKGNVMLEVYSAGNMQSTDYECGIWIPIVKKDAKIIGSIPEVSCPSFTDGQIPTKHTGFGEDISPEIVIKGLCAETKTLAVVMDDLDVPFIGELNHWIIWNLPTETVIPENIPDGAICENGAVQGVAYGKNRYRGPKQPPFIRKVHRYRFRVYALDCILDLPKSSRKNDLLSAMNGHILQSGEVVGTYRRNSHRK